MKKLSFFLVALLTTFALGLSGCSEDNTEPTAVPVITAADLSVPAEAGERSLSYEITDPIDGQMISASSNQTWVHDFDYSTPNVIKFQVDENTGEARTAELTLTYTQAEPVKVTLSQAEGNGSGPEKIDNVASAEVMPDEVFRNYVLTNFDTDGDGVLTVEEAAAVKDMEYTRSEELIYDLTGIEYFTGLETVNIISQGYNTADFTYNTNLKRVTVGYSNALETVNVSTCTNLEFLSVGGSSELTSLDVSNNPKLTQIVAYNTGLTTLDLTNNTNLTSLTVNGPNLENLDLSILPGLENLTIGGDIMTSVDVTKNVELKSLSVSGKNITKLDVSKNTKLISLSVSGTSLTTLDVSNCRELRSLNIDYTSISVLDLSSCLKLTSVSAYQNLSLQTVWLATGQTIDSTMGFSSDIIQYKDAVAPSDLTANAVDENFRTYLLDNFDTNGDGALSEEEAAAITEIDVTGKGITSIDGIEYFFMPNVRVLKLADNKLTSLDVVLLKNLEELYCSNNQIAGSMNFTTNKALRIFEADNNQLSGISNFGSKTERIIANNNQLTSATIYFISNLKEVNLADNQLTSFDCRSNDAITTVDISNNPGITSWQIWSMSTLENINISNTGITEFTTYGTSGGGYGPALKTLNCSGTPIESLDVSGNTSLEVLEATNCPNLKSVNIGSLNLTTMNVDEGVEIIKTEAPAGEGLAINEANFPDETFRNFLSENFDTDSNGLFSAEEIAAVKALEFEGPSRTITSLKGIERFTNLETLSLINVSGLTAIDMSTNPTLKEFCFEEGEDLTSIDVTQCPNLVVFRYKPYPSLTEVKEIDISNCPNIDFSYDVFYVCDDLQTLWISEAQEEAAMAWYNERGYGAYAMVSFKVKP